MARNVEIKARISCVEALLPAVAALADDGPVEIAQQDTFFRCNAGRLKLRDFMNGTGELIFYKRANEAGPKESFYLRSETATPEILKQSLALAYGEAGTVTKQRTLFLVGRTRVHLDKVQGLGHFLELEVVLSENESSEALRKRTNSCPSSASSRTSSSKEPMSSLPPRRYLTIPSRRPPPASSACRRQRLMSNVRPL